MNCIFCKIINNEIPSYTIYEDMTVKAFLDINPKSNGHILIVPKEHILDVDTIDNDTLIHIHETSKKMKSLLKTKLNWTGIAIVQNNGDIQEVKHYHVHIVPSYKNEMRLLDVKEVNEILTK